MTFLYDGDGRRVYKSSGKLYWYGAGDEILAETDGSGNTTAEYIFFGGKRIAMLPAGGSAQYYVEDFLGSSRIVAQSNGVVCYDGDFTPYGGELPYTNSCPAQNNYKFEGKERDTETQNDDFGARYYSWRFGRWLSADWSAVPVPVPYANLTNPQTLNLYAMVADDPESFADLDGHFGTCGIAAEFGCATSVGDAQSNGVTVGGQADSQVGASQKLTAEKQQQTALALANQVPPEVKGAIGASVAASNSPSAEAGDKTGGFHEEGGIWGADTAGKAVPVPAHPGKASDPRVEAAASIDVRNSANPALRQSLASIGGEWHVHPSGSVLGLDGNIHYFTQAPSRDIDIPRAVGPISIVVGARDKNVYFYNKAGIIGTVKLKDFLRP